MLNHCGMVELKTKRLLLRKMNENDAMLNLSDKLLEERWKNSEKLIEKQKEKAAEKKEEVEENLEEKRTAKEDEETPYEEAKKLLDEKLAASKDGMIRKVCIAAGFLKA